MNLLGRPVGLDQPFFPIAGPAWPLDCLDSLLSRA
jgi:hypothetical protein